MFNPTSAQEECTITPLNPTTLTATGGALASGTEDVMIQCSCTINNDDDIVRWYDPDGSKIINNECYHFIPDAPYYTRVNGPTDNRDLILIIPTFNDTYDGTYTCGRRITDTKFGTPNVSAVLTIAGKLMIHTLI